MEVNLTSLFSRISSHLTIPTVPFNEPTPMDTSTEATMMSASTASNMLSDPTSDVPIQSTDMAHSVSQKNPTMTQTQPPMMEPSSGGGDGDGHHTSSSTDPPSDTPKPTLYVSSWPQTPTPSQIPAPTSASSASFNKHLNLGIIIGFGVGGTILLLLLLALLILFIRRRRRSSGVINTSEASDVQTQPSFITRLFTGGRGMATTVTPFQISKTNQSSRGFARLEEKLGNVGNIPSHIVLPSRRADDRRDSSSEGHRSVGNSSRSWSSTLLEGYEGVVATRGKPSSLNGGMNARASSTLLGDGDSFRLDIEARIVSQTERLAQDIRDSPEITTGGSGSLGLHRDNQNGDARATQPEGIYSGSSSDSMDVSSPGLAPTLQSQSL